MLSVSKINDSAAAHHYFSEKDDYYLGDRGSGSAAQWWGAGATCAGLAGEVGPGAFKDLLDGRICDQQIGHADRHTPGWDATFSASKSVSVAALMYGDRRLVEAHDRAVRDALAVLEKHSAMTRQRDADGGYAFRGTGNLAAAVFRHASNRDQEPQLHSHAVIANATWDEKTQKWVSLWSHDGLYRAQREANVAYTNALAREARALGYHIEWTVNEKGHPVFELEEVAPELCEFFSGRTAAIDCELARHGLTRVTATPDQKQAATLATRRAKEHVPGAELARRWREQAAAHGADFEHTIPRTPAHTTVDDAREMQDADAAVARAIAQLSEREARFTRRELMVEACVYSQGRAGEKALSAALDRAHVHGTLIDRPVEIRAPGGGRSAVAGYTTETGAKTEKSMLVHSGAIAGPGRDGTRIGESEGRENTAQVIDQCIAAAEKIAGYAFTDEHHAAVHGILDQRGGLAIVQGHAGTAKTTAVLAVVAGRAREGGWKVRAMAPTSSAAQTLGDAIGAESTTVAAVIQRQQREPADNELWIVDEAGMVGAKDMDALLAKAERQGARVIVTGDDRQIGSVGAGRAFAQLQAEHPDVVYSLTEIKRQRSEELRSAIYDAIAGRAGEALGKVEVREQEDRDAGVGAVVDAYMASRAAGHDTLIVTLSRDDRAAVNAAVQERREAVGEVRDVQTVTTLADRQMTDAERADASRYQRGDVIQANRRFTHLDRGEMATVTGVADGKVTVQRSTGETWTFDPAHVNSYSVLQQQETRVGAGDELVAKGSVRAVDSEGSTVQLKNGEALAVTAVRTGELEVQDRTGRSYTIDTTQGARLDLAYGQTANQAQGKTTDKAIGYMRSSQSNLADQRRMYVTLSRARDSATVVTDSRERLADTIARNAGRKSTALDQDLDRPARDSIQRVTRDAAPQHHLPARDLALKTLAGFEAETRRMTDYGHRNERHWAALQAADRAKQGRAIDAEKRERQRQALIAQAVSRIDAREKAQIKAHEQRHGYALIAPTKRALRERCAIERHAREDRERVTLAFSGERDSKRGCQLDSRRIKDLKREIRAIRKRAKQIKRALSNGRGGPSPVRAWKRLQVDSKAYTRVQHIREKLDVVKARQANRKQRYRAAKAQEHARQQRQREQAKAARVPVPAQDREDYSRGR